MPSALVRARTRARRILVWLLPACSIGLLVACGDPLPPLRLHCPDGGCRARDGGGAGDDGGQSLPDGFVPGNCSDGVHNAFETGTDCGGPDCNACAEGQGCELPSDCASNLCTHGSCLRAECGDRSKDGDETDVDCGGGCRPCDGGKQCDAAADCASGECDGQRCGGPSCSDQQRNGDESDVDCGGQRCQACDIGKQCGAPSDCGSRQCSGGACVDLSCDDGRKDDSESDVDCGGNCRPCASGLACAGDADCASGHCLAELCVEGPSAGLKLSPGSGAAPLWVSASSSAKPGDSPIVEVLYDWDDGGGFEPHDTYRYTDGGSFTVRQLVRDKNGFSASASVRLTLSGFVPVRFDAQDHSASVYLSPDRLAVEQRGLDTGGARSNGAVMPGSGVYYFEAERLIEQVGVWGFGVATAAAPLPTEVGRSAESFGLLTMGEIQDQGATCTGSGNFGSAARNYGFVVDYRAASPKLHVLLPDDAGAPVVRRSCTLAVSAPLHILYYGARYVIGLQGRINAGSDTTNFPFHFGEAALKQALTTAGEAAAAGALTLGFGQTRARAPDMPPGLTVPADQDVALGTPVTLSATADDPEDNLLTDRIIWTDTASQHHAPVRGFGGSFIFTPTALGRHPIEVSVRDSDGLETRRTVLITATGSLPQADPVKLVPDALAGSGVELSSDALSARFMGNGKYGVRANQGIYGQFWYFEAHRAHGPENQGVGLVIGDGALNPYHFDAPPWSCSVNVSGSTWRNLISQSDWNALALTVADYGFAVDYRGVHPVVYVFVGNTLHDTFTLDDVWVPIYPMVYGNPRNEPSSDMDMTVNFGATPFKLDPRPLLGASASGLEMRWGANTPARP